MQSIIQKAFVIIFTINSLLTIAQQQVQVTGSSVSFYTNFNEAIDKEIDGTPFLYDDWKKIRLVLKNGTLIEEDEVKYHVAMEDLIFRIDESLYLSGYKLQFDHFILGDKKFIGSTYNKVLYGFFEVLHENENVVLLKKYNRSIRDGRMSNGILPATNDYYISSEDYFIKKVKDNSFPLKLKVTKKNVILKSSLYPELSNYLSKSKGNYSEENALIELIKGF